MANFSNHIMIAGQLYPLGDESIQVVGFWNNPDFAFHGMGPAAPTTNQGVLGLEVAPRERSAPARNRDMRAEPNPANLQANLDALRDQVRTAVIHHDGCYTASVCYRVLNNRNLSTHFMVNHDGNIIQGLDVWWKALHARGQNPVSIGIDMNNRAVPDEENRRQINDDLFGTVADYVSREIVEGLAGGSRPRRGFAYTEAQYNTLCKLLKLFNETFGLPLIYPQSPNGGGVLTTPMADPMSFRGFFGHWHCQPRKWDPGPGFDWNHLVECLHGKSNQWPIDLGTPSLRDLRTEEAVAAATDVYYQNTEQGPGGGTYPFGLNQQWHDGIHIYAEKGTPVKAVSDGKIILTRNGPNYPVGSPNFVLIQHDMLRERINIKPDGESEILEENLRWYSLYMHLERMEHSEVPADASPDAPDIPEEDEEGEEDAAEEVVEAPPEPGEARVIPPWYQRLVALARQYKNSALEPRPDFNMFDVQSDPEAFYERASALRRVQEFRHAYQCVEQGNPFRWVINPDEDDGMPVSAGDTIGYVGEYGQLAGESVRLHSMFQIQLFSLSPIFDDTRFDAEDWIRAQADLSGNDLVSAPALIYPVMGGEATAEELGVTRRDLGRGRVITPSEINAFFRGGGELARGRLRRLITYHLSEWDEALDDSLTADSPILWPWQTDAEFGAWRAHHIGFKWLTAETRTVLGMEGPQPIYTYHPIYLLGWWALNFGRSIGQAFEGLTGDELEEAILNQEESEEDAHAGEDEADHMLSIDDLADFRLSYPDFEDVSQGEWKPDEVVGDKFDPTN